jgi:uncharacterized protein YfaS (alpha-2-macroglobulin family)
MDAVGRIGASTLFVFLILLAFTQKGWSSPTLKITLYTDKAVYDIEEDISVLGDVKVEGVPVENASVALEVRDPAASPVIVRTLNTDASGEYSLSFRLSLEALTGTYTVNASCNYDAERAVNTTSFSLEKASVLVLTVTVGRSTYAPGETIEIYGDTTQANVPVVGVLVAVEVQDPKNTPLVMRVLETDADGLYGLAFRLPTGSPAGTYSVHASASYEDQEAVVDTSFQVQDEISADINGDGTVNILDLAIVALAWGSDPGHPRWDSRCDLDGNEIINIIDIALVALEYRP